MDENKSETSRSKLDVEAETKSNPRKKERSPATHRKLSDRASEYALVQYLSTLAKNRDAIESFDFAFVEYLLENGADINNCDVIGQSAFHIVAKFWSTDVARFLLDHGADINAQDCLGRSPMHEAAALNYVDMVEFLLQNGADLNIKSFDQEQRPIHFAAKNDSCQVLSTLLVYGADINSLDSKNRTPLQVAAEMNRAKVAELLINEGASAAIYDTDGNSALTLLAEKLPDVARMALDQLYSTDRVNRKEFFSLNSLEGPRVNTGRESVARTPLEIAVRNRRFSIIMHPVVQQLINVKWNDYGKWGAVRNLMWNLVYVMLWSILSLVLSYKSSDIYLPIGRNGWKLGIVIAIVIITEEEIRKHILDTLRVRRQEKDWIEWRARALEEDLAYCHPRCPEEWRYLSKEVKSVRNRSYLKTGDGWIYVDWLVVFLVIAAMITHIIFLALDTIAAYKVHCGVFIGLLLVLWLRIAKYARPFQSTGPIVVIFSHIVKDIAKCSFLFAILFIPYACAFWIAYGSNSPEPVEGYCHMYDLLYSMLCMVVGVDFPVENLLAVDPFMARILCSTFIISTAIVVVNLLIALLSDTFTRLYSNAVANAIMQRAQSILVIERTLCKKRKRKYYRFVRDNCSPLVVSMDRETVNRHKQEKICNFEKISGEIKQLNDAIRHLQESKATNNGEPGTQPDIASLKYMITQLLKQSQENATKIGKLYQQLVQRNEILSYPPAPVRNRFGARRTSVISTVSVRTEVFGCLDVDTAASEDSSEEQDDPVIIQETEEVTVSMEEPIPSESKIVGQTKAVKPYKRARFRSIGEDNRGFDDGERDEARPCCSSWSREQNQEQLRINGRRTLRQSSIISYASPALHEVLAQRFLQLDRKDSNDGSISL